MVPQARRSRWTALALGLLSLAAMLALDPRNLDSDFCTYYAAGRLALAGHPEQAFDQESIVAEHNRFHNAERRPGAFLYSPVFLPLASGLAKLPFAAAQALHRTLLPLILAAGLAVLLWNERRPLLQAVLASAFTLSYATGATLFFQNWTALLFLLLAIAFEARRAGDSGASAAGLVAFALALHLKPFVALLLVPLFLARDWRRFWSILAVAALLAALALPLAGTASFANWLGFGGEIGKVGVFSYQNNVSLPGAVARLAVPFNEWLRPKPTGHGIALYGPLALGLPLLAYGLRRLRDDVERAQAFALLWLLLFFPLVWNHTSLLALLAIPLLRSRWAIAVSLAFAASGLLPALQHRTLSALFSGTLPASQAHWVFALPLMLNTALMIALLVSRSPSGRAPAQPNSPAIAAS